MERKADFIIKNTYKYGAFSVDREFLVEEKGIFEGKMRFYDMLEDREFLREMDDFSIGFKRDGKDVVFYPIRP